jgi:hypothetical protein
MLSYVPSGLTFNSFMLCPHSEFTCFVCISEQTATFAIYSNNCLVFVTETECLLCGTTWVFKWERNHRIGQNLSAFTLTKWAQLQFFFFYFKVEEYKFTFRNLDPSNQETNFCFVPIQPFLPSSPVSFAFFPPPPLPSAFPATVVILHFSIKLCRFRLREAQGC